MDAKQHLYYALGSLAYAVAKADGKVQNEEKELVKKIVNEGTKHEIDFNYTDIIFHILQKDNMGFKEVYIWAMRSFEIGKYHFTADMKTEFIDVITKVAEVFPPNNEDEKIMLARFGADIEKLKVNTIID